MSYLNKKGAFGLTVEQIVKLTVILALALTLFYLIFIGDNIADNLMGMIF